MSDFEAWFIAQHGRRDLENVTDKQLQDLVSDGKAAERALGRRQIWDEKYQAALYAWQARADKRGGK